MLSLIIFRKRNVTDCASTCFLNLDITDCIVIQTVNLFKYLNLKSTRQRIGNSSWTKRNCETFELYHGTKLSIQSKEGIFLKFH